MYIQQIITHRNRSTGKDYGIVNEWEDIFAEMLGAELYYDDWKRRSNRFCFHFPRFAETFMQTGKSAFKFTMLPLGNPPGCNKRNIVPCIVDFFLRDDEELQRFYKEYSRNPLVLISSKEAYDFLCEKKCPLNIAHLALSLPDMYSVTPETVFNKKYDVVMLGRKNTVLMEYLKRYKKTHADLTYVYGEKRDLNFEYFNQEGESLGTLSTREEYFAMLRQSRIGLYATPGMDNSRGNTNGFSQVTPRMLEYIACGCHVISRYTVNSDTDYYEMEKITMKADSYEEFEMAMDKARSSVVDMQSYSDYLSIHYTSMRVEELKMRLLNI